MMIIDETQFLMQITIKDMQKLQQIFLKEVIPEEVYYYKYTMKFFVKIHEKANVDFIFNTKCSENYLSGSDFNYHH